MMLRIEFAEQNNWKPKTKIGSKNLVKYNKIFSVNNIHNSDLKWEDIAGLSLNVSEEDE